MTFSYIDMDDKSENFDRFNHWFNGFQLVYDRLLYFGLLFAQINAKFVQKIRLDKKKKNTNISMIYWPINNLRCSFHIIGICAYKHGNSQY